MNIEGKVKIDNILTVDDLNDGDVFVFKDNPDEILLKICDLNYEVVNLKNRELYELSCDEENYRAVERVNCKLIIE